MLCGSCIRDNALARALAGRGHDVRLVPLYQRSRTDERSVSEGRIRFGGISVFLQHAAPLFGAVPGLDRILDSAVLLGFAERFSSTTDPTRLGPLTVTTLEGERGSARRAVEALAESVRDAGPDVVVLPNSLLLGLAGPLAAATGAPVVVTFSGEDLFLSQLPPADRERALGLMREALDTADHFVGVTEYHARAMADTLGIPDDRVSFVRLGVDAEGFPAEPKVPPAAATDGAPRPVTIGFFSRIAPEKGLDRLARAALQLAVQPEIPPLRVRAAGWMNRAGRGYLDEVRRLFGSDQARVSFEYLGELDRRGKIAFLREADVVAIPATFPEPKGIPAIEAMMAGTPVVVPQQGAYPALLDRAEGGVLARSSEPEDFAAALSQLVLHPERRASVGARGFERVREEHSADRMAEEAEAAFARVLAA